uniref:THAP-type domain-containing protein n=1 Tax=Gouania willdenowi TaxID=441366 RepID=A0A8C5G2W5_GOUWI
MGVMCAVFGCSNNSARHNVSFFSLPTVKQREGPEVEGLTRRRQRQWLANLHRSDIKPTSYKYTRVCEEHFVKGKPAYEMHEVDVDWAPTLKLGHSKIKSASVARQVERATLGQSEDCSEYMTSEMPSSVGAEPILGQTMNVDHEIQTEMPASQINDLEEGLKYANEQIYELRKKVDDLSMNEDSFRNDHEKVKFYTGLSSFSVLMCVFNFIAPYITTTHINVLSQFQELLIVLMRLRLNSPFQDLAYRFGVSVSTASLIFDRWIPVMDIRLSSLIVWPERDVLQKTMPLSFRRSFGNKIAVIIDCFEVFIDRTSTLSSRAMTWSNYKHHTNTAKFLIGVTPQGVISFISKAWGGHVSDKHITENCSILTHLLPGDLVLADRGFDIADHVGFYCAKLAIPAFTPGKSQLSALEIEEMRKIANVRIHVERVIGLVRRKFPILRSTWPIETVTCTEGQEDTPLDMIVRVCCTLTNLCPSVVPFE